MNFSNDDLAIMDNLLGVIANSDAWNREQQQNPEILTASDKMDAALDRIRGVVPDEAIGQIEDAALDYQKAVDARDAKIKELRDDLSKQLAGIEEKAAALNAAMLKAAMDGDGVEQDKAQCALTELEGQRSQLNARLELLNGKPPRCGEAYDAMNMAALESEKADEQYFDDIGAIREFCERMIQPWTEITSALRHSGEAVSRFHLDRARRHYDSEH